MTLRRPRFTARRILIAALATPIALFAAGYLVLAIMTRGAPPPPSFSRTVTASYEVAVDGVWHDGDCRKRTIAGGWLLPVSAAGAPVDLTAVKLGDGRWPSQNRLQLGALTLKRGACQS